MRGTTALLTDHYELTMLQSALAHGTAQRRTIFEVFARQLPNGRRYGVVAGTERLLTALEKFQFDDEALGFLHDNAILDDATLTWLSNYRFSGHIWGYGEGEVYFPSSPLLVVEAPFAEAVVLETLILSIMNFDSAIASAASRMTLAAGDRPCIEMGSRRTHERGAVDAARAAYIAGFASTSNLEAGRTYGVPTAGTSAHAFILLHDSEREAFSAQIASQGTGTTLLVDTYDVSVAIEAALDVAGPNLGAVRLDSGDLGNLATQTRQQLDDHGAKGTKIVASGDLDEHSIARLASYPVDAYGVGTSVVTGSGAPTAGLIYKMVARENNSGQLEAVHKTSPNKVGVGGRKYPFRRYDDHGTAAAEVIGINHQPELFTPHDRPLLVPLVQAGQVVGHEPISAAHKRHDQSRAELPVEALRLTAGQPAIPTLYEELS